MAEKPSFSDILVQGRNILKQAGIEDWELDAWYLLGHITAMGRAEYFLRELEMVPENIVDEYYKLINIRASHVPLQHITGSQEFMGLNFLVSSDVLVPRQDTETLVEYLLPYVKNKHVLDICTGSGCIAISIMKLGGAASMIYPCDIPVANLKPYFSFFPSYIKVKEVRFHSYEPSYDTSEEVFIVNFLVS